MTDNITTKDAEEPVESMEEWMQRHLTRDLLWTLPVPSRAFLKEMGWNNGCYQVVVSTGYKKKKLAKGYRLSDMLLLNKNENIRISYYYDSGFEFILLLDRVAVNKLDSIVKHWKSMPPQENSVFYDLFFSYGRVVSDPKDIGISYNQARKLMDRQFFSQKGEHILGTAEMELLEEMQTHEELDVEKADEYCDLLFSSVQAINHSKLTEILDDIYSYLSYCKTTEEQVKLFLLDLFMLIREKLHAAYSGDKIFEESTRYYLNVIYSKNYLYEIIETFRDSLEVVMYIIGGPSRDNVLNDILNYVAHNYDRSLKLETLAPLFGYNSAYLGKIFRKGVGVPFTRYVDMVRIERAKELLMRGNDKVYKISETVGYHSVDYFHRKFQKYVGMSPAEYRRNYLETGREE
ncbi:MAG: AraC family transcriptional regulator [Lachnospiraceae bacterium]|nr:AraC family transcriptional regulator [Lachnospiraceae bacterium]